MVSGEEPSAVVNKTRAGRWWWGLALGLAVVQLGLLLATAWDKSDTVDEAGYLIDGIRYWEDGDFVTRCESPPLPKWGFALALRLVAPDLFVSPRPHPLYDQELPVMRRNLLAARSATALVTVLAGLLLWSAGRGLLGPAGGFLTHALWCFSPTVLANGSLATLDAWAASFCAATLWATARFVARPSLFRSTVIGLTLGLAAVSKVTTLGMLPVLAVVGGIAVARSHRGPRGRLAGAIGLRVIGCALAALLTVWASYRFDTGYVPRTRDCRLVTNPEEARLGPVPFPMYIQSGLRQWGHGQRGHLNYLFGETRSDGWWWFYLAALLLKTTLGAQALLLLRLLGSRLLTRREALADLAVLAFPALLLLVMSLGHTQNGIKYILPAFPFGMLWLGRAAPLLSRWLGVLGTRAWQLALALGVAGSLAIHPHYLMFFNTWAGGPEGGPRYLIHGDDWGQDQRRLAEWQAKHGLRRRATFFYAAYSGNPDAWGVVWRKPRCQPTVGTHALQAVEVFRPKRWPRGCLDWLTVEPPDERIGYSIFIYRVDEERLKRLAAERDTRHPFWRSGPPPSGTGR
jgi:hypothetical protein